MDIHHDDVETLDEPQIITSVQRTKPPLLVYIGDFFNTVKAFIGTNYQGLPFAFAQSGLAFGIAGVFLIATLTDHCICLLIRCKYIVINNIIHECSTRNPTSAEDLENLRTRLEKGLGYGDVGRIALGRVGKIVIDIAVWYTQIMTCVCYFIFIGNATVNLFPLVPALVPLNGSNNSVQPEGYRNLIFPPGEGNLLPSADKIDYATKLFQQPRSISIPHESLGQFNNLSSPSTATIVTAAVSTAATTNLTTLPPTPEIVMKPMHPSLKLLVMIPLPLFLITALIRNVRWLSPFSIIATLSLFLGAGAVLVFLAVGFKLVSHFEWMKFATLPLFIGQISGAYEGIGCIMPIEGSMDGNREVFPIFLHVAVYLVFCILCSFGILGYLIYGESVNQLIIMNLGTQGLYVILVNLTLILSVACTFPLQFFPAVQIVEGYLFSEGGICGPSKRKRSLSITESDPLLSPGEDNENDGYHSTSNIVPNTVPGWKRNVVRILMVLVSMGLAVLLRNNYAYLSSISGALGASLLAFIIPCAVHLKLRWTELSVFVKFKDIAIIVISTACSIAALVVFTKKLVDGEVKV